MPRMQLGHMKRASAEEEEDEEEEGPFAGLEKETVGILADKVGGESGGH